VVRVSQRIERTDHGHGWNPTVHPLVRSTNGDWTITVYLSPGRVIYHFDGDGAFWLDPYDDRRIRNARGSQYSVRHITSRGDFDGAA